MGKKRCKNRKCQYYHKYTWGEPPLEEGGNGTSHTEEACDKVLHYFVPACNGIRKQCNLPRISEGG